MSKCLVVWFVCVESHRGVSELTGFPRVATVVMFVQLVVEEVDGGEWLACLPSPTVARTVEDEEDPSSFFLTFVLLLAPEGGLFLSHPPCQSLIRRDKIEACICLQLLE